MKTLILSLLLFAMAYFSDAQNVNIPDASFKSALISAGVDTNEDEEISSAEAEAINSLDVSSKSISDMTGIEAFVNLDSLNCHENQLITLDVSDNTELILLACGSNQLTNLDVSGCKALTVLFCFDNQLTSLDVSGCTALKYLVCFFNLLTNLDLSNNTALEYLKCNDNQLISLDVAGCIALTELICFWNQLTSLDVTDNTALINLDCSVNQLDSLNISNNINLLNLNLSYMETLYKVCVWEMPFPPAGTNVETIESPNVYFTTDCSATALKPVRTKSRICIYPNPAGEYIVIDISNNSSFAKVELYDLQGKKVLEHRLSDNNRVQINRLSKGLYLYRLHDNGNVYEGKVTVE